MQIRESERAEQEVGEVPSQNHECSHDLADWKLLNILVSMNKNPKSFKAYNCVLLFAHFGFLITKQAYLSELSWEAWNYNCKCNKTMKKARDHFRNLFWGHPSAANIQLLQNSYNYYVPKLKVIA